MVTSSLVALLMADVVLSRSVTTAYWFSRLPHSIQNGCLKMRNFGMPADCLPSGGAENEAEPDAETLEYLTGKKEVPVPTFFIGAFGAGSRSPSALFVPR